MLIKASITGLEATLSGKSTKHYLWVHVAYGKSKQAAVGRPLRQRGITTDDIECMWLWGNNFCESADFKNYGRKENLIGYQEATRELRIWLDAQNGDSLGPPSLRSGFKEEEG